MKYDLLLSTLITISFVVIVGYFAAKFNAYGSRSGWNLSHKPTARKQSIPFASRASVRIIFLFIVSISMYSIYSNISDIRKREKEFARNQKLFNVDYLKSLSSSDVWSVRLGDIVRKEIEFEYACILGAYETGIWADRQLVQNQWDNIVINTYHADNNLDSFTTHSHIIIKHKNELHHLSFRKYGLTFLQENETQCHKDRNVLIDIRSRRRL